MSYGGITGQTPNMENVTGVLPVENGGTGTNNLEELLDSRPGIKWIHKSVPANGVIFGAGEYFPKTTFGLLVVLNGTSASNKVREYVIQQVADRRTRSVTIVGGSGSTYSGVGAYFYPFTRILGDLDNKFDIGLNTTDTIIYFYFRYTSNGFTVASGEQLTFVCQNSDNMPNADFYWLYFQP